MSKVVKTFIYLYAAISFWLHIPNDATGANLPGAVPQEFSAVPPSTTPEPYPESDWPRLISPLPLSVARLILMFTQNGIGRVLEPRVTPASTFN